MSWEWWWGKWHQGALLWLRDLHWSLLRRTVLFVHSCGHSFSLASGNLSVLSLVLGVSSLPRGKVLAFSPGCAVVAESGHKGATLIQADGISCSGGSRALGRPCGPDTFSSQLLKACLLVLLYSLHLMASVRIIITLAG